MAAVHTAAGRWREHCGRGAARPRTAAQHQCVAARSVFAAALRRLLAAAVLIHARWQQPQRGNQLHSPTPTPTPAGLGAGSVQQPAQSSASAAASPASAPVPAALQAQQGLQQLRTAAHQYSQMGVLLGQMYKEKVPQLKQLNATLQAGIQSNVSAGRGGAGQAGAPCAARAAVRRRMARVWAAAAFAAAVRRSVPWPPRRHALASSCPPCPCRAEERAREDTPAGSI